MAKNDTSVAVDTSAEKVKQKRNVQPRVLTVIASVDSEGKIVVHAASHNGNALLEKFSELANAGVSSQIIRIKSDKAAA